MIRITLIDRMVDLLLDMPDQPLSCATAGGGQLWHALFLQTRTEFGLPAALGTITLVAGSPGFVKRTPMLAGAGRDEIGNGSVDGFHPRTPDLLSHHLLIVGEPGPPHPLEPILFYAMVEVRY